MNTIRVLTFMPFLLLGACSACNFSPDMEACNKPANMTNAQWHAKMKKDGYTFWERNANIPFSIIPLAIDGLKQYND